MNYDQPNAKIHVLARGLILQGEQILLCHTKGSSWYFLPGGHVENSEDAKSSLLRELNEEIDGCSFELQELIGVCENTFNLKDDLLQQEINLVFKVLLDPASTPVSKEEHLEFVLVSREEFQSAKVLPQSLHEGVLEWMNTGKTFYR